MFFSYPIPARHSSVAYDILSSQWGFPFSPISIRLQGFKVTNS